MAQSRLQRDLQDAEAIGKFMAHRGLATGEPDPSRPQGAPPIPVVTKVEPIVSDPAEGDVSDHYRYSSPNRNRSHSDTTMRHKRVKDG